MEKFREIDLLFVFGLLMCLVLTGVCLWHVKSLRSDVNAISDPVIEQTLPTEEELPSIPEIEQEEPEDQEEEEMPPPAPEQDQRRPRWPGRPGG